MMRGRVVLRRLVALCADAVARRAQLLRVRLVAVTAGHARGVHAALQPRAPDVDLVALLPVGVVQAGLEQCGQVVVEEGLSGAIAFGDLRTTGMTLCADGDLTLTGTRGAALRLAASWIQGPADAAPLIQRDRQSRVVASSCRRGPSPRAPSPGRGRLRSRP